MARSARRRDKLIRFDFRGGGLSQRDLASVNIEDFECDIGAVLEAAGVGSAAIFAQGGAAPIAVHLAASKPELVSQLFPYDAWANGQRLPIHTRFAELDRLIEIDWPMYTEIVAKVMMRSEGAEAKGAASYLRRCANPADWQLVVEAVRAFDVESLLSEVRCPTVVIHSAGNRLAPIECSRDLATDIRAAELRVIDREALPTGGVEEVAEVIESSLGIQPPARAPSPLPSCLRTILFTDVEGHSTMMERLGDDAGRTLLREHERLTREALRAHSGEEIKSLGDGFMASFGPAQRALDCAIALQRAITDSATGLRVRCGINAGEPIAEDGDLFGQSVITASRIAGLATGGQILVANVVRELAAGRAFLFTDRGEQAVRGMGQPVRVWELDWNGGIGWPS